MSSPITITAIPGKGAMGPDVELSTKHRYRQTAFPMHESDNNAMSGAGSRRLTIGQTDRIRMIPGIIPMTAAIARCFMIRSVSRITCASPSEVSRSAAYSCMRESGCWVSSLLINVDGMFVKLLSNHSRKPHVPTTASVSSVVT